MKFSKTRTRIILLALPMMLALASCSDKTTTGPPDGTFSGITRTDETGYILALDPNDWVLQGVIIGTRLFADPNSFSFKIDEIGNSATGTLRLLNFSAETVAVSCAVDPEGSLSLDPAGGSIEPDADLMVEVSYTQADEAIYAGELTVTADPEETLSIALSGALDDGGISESPIGGFAFGPAYPNPSNSGTTITFALPEASEVSLLIYNSNRHVVRTLIAEQRNAGLHIVEWDGKNGDGANVPGGIYAAKITVGETVAWGDIHVSR